MHPQLEDSPPGSFGLLQEDHTLPYRSTRNDRASSSSADSSKDHTSSSPDSSEDDHTPPSPEPPEDDSHSQTSTTEWGHEPFESYSLLVKRLVRTKWPSVPCEAISVERMAGGGFNRIIGFSIPDTASASQDQYVLRIPRLLNIQIDHNNTPVQFVRKYTTLPVPTIVDFDSTTDNVLREPYSIQRRIPGKNLVYCFLDLDHDAKCEVTRSLGDACSQLLSLKSQHVGRLISIHSGLHKVPEFMVETLEGTGSPATFPYSAHVAAQDASQRISAIFQYRHEQALISGSNNKFRAEYMAKFATMAEELDAEGYFKDVSLSLCHLDLEPYNVLVRPSNGKMEVSAILDWDDALFLPDFMSCKPPLWIWGWNDDEDENERIANETPATAENQELKRIFEEAAGPLYMRFAYNTAYRLARRLVRFGLFCIKSNEDMDEADAMLKEWSEFKTDIARIGVTSMDDHSENT